MSSQHQVSVCQASGHQVHVHCSFWCQLSINSDSSQRQVSSVKSDSSQKQVSIPSESSQCQVIIKSVTSEYWASTKLASSQQHVRVKSTSSQYWISIKSASCQCLSGVQRSFTCVKGLAYKIYEPSFLALELLNGLNLNPNCLINANEHLLSSKMSAYSVVRAGKYEVTSRSLGCCLTTTALELDRIGDPQYTTAAETIKRQNYRTDSQCNNSSYRVDIGTF